MTLATLRQAQQLQHDEQTMTQEIGLPADRNASLQPVHHVLGSTELPGALQLLASDDFVALDTEFMRESTYYPGLCLVQIAGAQHCVVVDPLAVADLTPLWNFLADRARVKVLHAARQDLEVLSQAMARAGLPIPGPVFDTQVAGALLGLPAQIGYAGLVSARLGHDPPKGLARTDWARRPLSAEQLAYAADDVRYLARLYPGLRSELQAAGRLDWLLDSAHELEDAALYRTEPADAWRRLKGLDRMSSRQRAAAKSLADWREVRAMQSDKPRGWILADESLRELAERLPETEEELQAIRSLPPGTVRKRGTELLGLIAASRAGAANEPPQNLPTRPDPAQLARVAELMAVVRAQASQLSIAPELLATRRDVEHLVFSGHSEQLLSGWRRALIGERLLALLG
jgi:ribonuclease D